MARWLIYTKERFPLLSYLLIAVGVTFSAAVLHANRMSLNDLLAPLFLIKATFSLVGLLLFFFQLRLMDELKDFEKDKIANPTRPLPRGLLKLSEVENLIILLQISMLLLAVLLCFFKFFSAGVIYFGTTLWLFLMYKEFFVGRWLSKRPLLYAISHQVICLPLALSPVFLFLPWSSQSFYELQKSFLLGLQLMSGFFCYEICRKLNPLANPILGTYYVVFGFIKTALLLALVLGISVIIVNLIDSRLLTSGSILATAVLAGYLAIMGSRFATKKFKIVEALASVFLFYQIWSVFFLTFFANLTE